MHTSLLLFLGDIGGSELMLIMVVILIFFGANKIPELARGLGKGIREFKDASTEIRREFEQAGQPTPPNPQPPYVQPQPTQQYPHPYDYTTTPPAADGSGTEPWAAPAAPAAGVPVATAPALTADADDDAPYVPPTLPPNLAPEGTQPRQPFRPASPDA